MSRQIIISLVSVIVCSCATAPPVQVPDIGVNIPETWTAKTTETGQVAVRWWEDFADADLVKTVEMALERNFDLQGAAARLEMAAAEATISSADLQPTVNSSYTRYQRKQNFVGFPIPGAEDQVLSTVSTNHGISLDVSWELDLWGRLRASTQAALANLQASAADFRGAQLSIAGQTVKTWFAIAEAQQQIDLSRETVTSFRESADRVRERFEAGIRPSLDLRLALLNLSNAEALLEQRLQQFDSATRQLKVLLSEYADGTIEPPASLPTVAPHVPSGLPADLVARRPDLVAAERQLAAAEARVGVARKERLPRIRLTAGGGTATDALRSLINGDFSVWSLLADVTAPLWQGKGRFGAHIGRAEAESATALASYANTALIAYAEVETALAAEQFLEDREKHLVISAEQARAAETLSEERYRAGLESYITVLDSQRSAVQVEGELIAAKRLRLENRVDLYLALGGGFEQIESPFMLENSGGFFN
tara:strand:- start:8533 stop:9981 length:1449 start_codon:yes stop_codon:yes gene_type:complete